MSNPNSESFTNVIVIFNTKSPRNNAVIFVPEIFNINEVTLKEGFGNPKPD
ncbi:7975_t:CDS:1, partial [Racocetra persica]